MFALFRILQRSGGILAVAVALLGLAFYGIALLSVAMVDDPGRGLQILGVFVVLSVGFGLVLIWAVRKALAQAKRPLDSAYHATTRIASMGGKGGREAFLFIGRKTVAARSFVSTVTGAAGRATSQVSRFIFRREFLLRRIGRDASPSKADVIPLRRSKNQRKSSMR